MRVVGGAWRGRPLVAPAGRGTRPTSDKVREAIFDVLQALPELRAGGGVRLAGGRRRDVVRSRAREPLPRPGPSPATPCSTCTPAAAPWASRRSSRGAARCTFVERDRAALAALRRNLARRRRDGACGARRRRPTCVAPCRLTPAPGAMYTLVLADPPYARSADAQDALDPARWVPSSRRRP